MRIYNFEMIKDDFPFEMRPIDLSQSNIKDPLKMINDSLFEMSDSDLNRFEMIYDCHFEMTAKNFRHQIYFGY